MPILEACRTFKKQPYIVLQPFLIDAILLAVLYGSHAWEVQSQWSSRVILGIGIPSVFQLYSLPFTWFMLAAAVLWSFAQGGYISTLAAACRGSKLHASQILRANLRFGPPFLLLQAAMVLATSTVSTLLILLFGAIGSGAALLFFIAFRILFVFLEFTVVTDRVPFDAAFRRAFRSLKQHWPASVAMAAVILVVSGLASLAANLFAAPVQLVLILIVYDTMMSVLLLALMLTYQEARRYEG
ncbi:hypothetical protein RJP21_15580 [Paenibacillus sp. VCA1]|uniref:hypothetical protein n=1 Tax=Paenibacillus sp. VCA1 TaxID=3039148 RepID=UPI00287250F1|nr:hypothetical protein [Paenibacillus sp. VCA1]MDR9855036.1 hypothetical protein [Paenibacillus sp. VCA1]